jgi:hypothetical protein
MMNSHARKLFVHCGGLVLMDFSGGLFLTGTASLAEQLDRRFHVFV